MEKNKNLDIQTKSYIRRLGGLASLNDHEPPIGTGGGRVFVDIPQGVTLVDPQPGHGPYIYRFVNDSGSEDIHYTGISALLTLTENDSGYVDVVTYSTSAADGAKLCIWFSENNTDPDFTLEVFGSERQLTIAYKLDPPIPNPTKTHRPYRRICSNPKAEIKKWKLVGADGATLQDPISGAMLEDFGDDEYHFYISFAHHEHED